MTAKHSTQKAENQLETGDLSAAKTSLLQALEYNPSAKDIERTLRASNVLITLQILEKKNDKKNPLKSKGPLKVSFPRKNNKSKLNSETPKHYSKKDSCNSKTSQSP